MSEFDPRWHVPEERRACCPRFIRLATPFRDTYLFGDPWPAFSPGDIRCHAGGPDPSLGRGNSGTRTLLEAGQTTTILDDGDPGFSLVQGTWYYNNQSTSYYANDHHYAGAGTGGSRAQWLFADVLEDTTYRVSATWFADPNRTTNALYKVLIDGVEQASLRVNQELAPNDFVDAVWPWEELLSIRIPADADPGDTASLAIQLWNDANEYVIADAVRVDQVVGPEIEVSVDGAVLKNGQTTVDYQTVLTGAAVTKQFTVRNLGPTPLEIGPDVSLPTGYEVVSRFGRTVLAPDDAAAGGDDETTFSVRLRAETAGTYSGELSFTTNDPDEAPCHFPLAGTVSARRVLDNGQLGFATQGPSWRVGATDTHYYRSSHVYASSTAAQSTATWTFADLQPGRYRVYATWYEASNRSGQVTYTVSAPQATPHTTVVNQKTAPNDLLVPGDDPVNPTKTVGWEKISPLSPDYFVVPDTAAATETLTATIVNTSTSLGYVIADGIRIEYLNQAPAIDDQTLSVAENSPDDTVVGTPTASDPDGQMLTYQILSGNVGGVFAMDGATGRITVADSSLLDHETTPSYTLTVSVCDGSLQDTGQITVNVTDVNEPPALWNVPSEVTIPELSPYTFTASATDPDIPAQPLTFSLIGGPTGAQIGQASGVFTWTPSEAQGPGDYPFTVRVEDHLPNGATGNHTDRTVTVHVTEVTSDPVLSNVHVVAGSHEGDLGTVSGAILAAGASGDLQLRINWGDGVVQNFGYPAGVTPFTLSHAFRDQSTGISLKLFDDQGVLCSDLLQPVTVSNVAPQLTELSATSVDENDWITLSGHIVDPGIADSFVLSVDWGYGELQTVTYPAGTTEFSLTHRYLDDAPSGTDSDNYQLELTLRDDDGGETTTVTGTQIGNTSPQLVLDEVLPVDENGTVTIHGTIVDQGWKDYHFLEVNWGEGFLEKYTYAPVDTGGTPAPEENCSTPFSIHHQYLDDPAGASESFTVTLKLLDDDDASITMDVPAPVHDLAPSLDNLTVSDCAETQTVYLTGVICDPGTLDTFTLTVNWRDGNSEVWNYAAGATSFSLGHFYDDDRGAGAGGYPIHLTLADDDGLTCFEECTADVTNQAPVLSNVQLTSGVFEGDVVVLAGRASDPSIADTLTLDINWGDGTSESHEYTQATDFCWTHRYVDNDPEATPPDVYTVSVTLTDDDDGETAMSLGVAVSDVAPSLSGVRFVATNVELGDQALLVGRVDDPGEQDSLSLVVDWGDESAPQELTPAAGDELALYHTYSTAGAHVATLTLTDDDQEVATKTCWVFVHEGAASETVLGGGELTVAPGTPIQLSGLVVGTTTQGLQGQVIFGDGGTGTVTFAADGSGRFETSSHGYSSSPGLYTAVITIYGALNQLIGEAVYIISVLPPNNDLNAIQVTLDHRFAFAWEAGPRPAQITAICKPGPAAQDIVVDIHDVSPSPTSGDYIDFDRHPVIRAGTDRVTWWVWPLQDEDQNDEQIIADCSWEVFTGGTMTASGDTNPREAVINILDDDSTPPLVSVSGGAPISESGPTAGHFTITRQATSTVPLDVQFDLVGTAVEGVDYPLISRTKTILANETSVSVDIPPADDALYEGSEWVALTMRPGPNYRSTTPRTQYLKILDDDPQLSANARPRNPTPPSTASRCPGNRHSSRPSPPALA